MLRISEKKTRLGEGISVGTKNHDIFWVDIDSNAVFWKSGQDSVAIEYNKWSLPSCTFQGNDEWVFIAHAGGIDRFSKGSQISEHCISWFDSSSGLRCNDGTMDAYGNIWISTMSTEHTVGHGSIWFWDKKSNPRLVLDSLTIPNSIAVDTKNRKLYIGDSHIGEIQVADLDYIAMESFEFKTFLPSQTSLGTPDGSTLDEFGNLWNTRWDGSSIIRINRGGEIEKIIKLNFSRPTSCALDYEQSHIYVTSAIQPNEVQSGHTFQIPLT